MIPKEAIEKAIEGGWEKEHLSNLRSEYQTFKVVVSITEYAGMQYLDGSFGQYPLQVIALDRTFWECLWIGLGHTFAVDGVAKGLEFCHIILTNGDIEAFWDELLTQQQ